ncbi:hypothetical protein WA1_51445 [Scytonema hofmannii PCC 7110]|uniref:Transposase n=1 Tax=Scytonema hofmannii PCC 7110 TaxID=128403 RepID=A0A139WQB3_9CYAN|nr:DUF6262 family protein [Scytonema hofmannii]KYC34614.1 hypothetical protein WA1_51445 [Scytonema hofmannii PCC 7110]
MSKQNKEQRIARLSAATEQKKQEALVATEKAINKLQKEGKVISFKAVAREAQVSTSYLYKYPELKAKILQLREEQRYSGKRVIPVASERSKNRIISYLKNRIKDLEEEVAQLRYANESLAGKAFELSEYENTVVRFRQHNEKLNAELERLAEENTELKNKLACYNLTPQSKVTSIHSKNRQRTPYIPVPDSVKDELKNLKIKINSTLRTLIRQNPEEVVLEAIEALKYALNNQEVSNPSGWLNKAIKNRWKKPEDVLQPIQNNVQDESLELVFPEGFEEWYIQAIDSGFIVNESPIELPKNIKGELLVKVNRPNASGLPHSLMSWIEAKKMMDAESK